MRKKTSEIDFINGEIVSLASHFHLLTPLNSRVVDLVHEVELSGKYFTADEIKEAFNLVQTR